MAFLFSKHRRQSSADRPHTYNRKPSLDLLNGEQPQNAFLDQSPTTTTAASKINALKQKLTSKSILNLAGKHDEPSSPASPSQRRVSPSSVGFSPTSPSASVSKSGIRGSLAASANPQAPPTSSDRLADVTGSRDVYPPGTTFFSNVERPANENLASRDSNLQPDLFPGGTRAKLNEHWKPIEPERRPLGPTTANGDLPSTIFRPPGQPSTSTTPRTSARPEVGKISIPPPNLPSRLASSAHFRDSPTSSPGGWNVRTPVSASARTPGGNGWGMTIIPSTPLPRPIANLPTLRDSRTEGMPSGSKQSSRPPSSREGAAGGYGFPVMPAGLNGSSEANGQGGSRSGSAATSPNGGNESTSAEIRRAKKHMPVMLREPSHQPPPHAPEIQEDSEDDDDDDDDDDESSSEEGEGSGAGSSDSETETEEGVETRGSSSSQTGTSSGPSRSTGTDVPTTQAFSLGTSGSAATRILLHNRPRQGSGPPQLGHGRQLSVSSISEENEEDSNPSPNFANYNIPSSPTQQTSSSDVNGIVPINTSSSQRSALSNRRHIDQPRLSLSSLGSSDSRPAQPATWNLATPKTPTADVPVFFAPSANQPMQWTSFNSATPTGGPPPIDANPGTSRKRTDLEPSQPPTSSAGISGDAPPQDTSPRSHTQGEYFSATAPGNEYRVSANTGTTLAGDNARTPMPVDRPLPTETADIASPLAALKLGAPVAASTPVAESSVSTPMLAMNPGGQPSFAVLEHATADDEPVLLNTIPGPPEALNDSVPNSTTLTPSGESPIPGAGFTRPSFHKQASRSMVNLASSFREEDNELRPPMPLSAGMNRTFTNASSISNLSTRPPSGARTPGSARSSFDWAKPPPTPGIGMTQPFKFPGAAESQHSSKQVVQNRQLQALGPSPMKRRRSMDDIREKLPDYAPPAKGIFLPRPREEEGREKLPEYFCHVHIEGYLPRKMEFTAPGVQARDRSWKRHYFVIHGTALSVYKHDMHKIPLKSGDPHAIPEVDEADYDNLHVHRPGELRRGSMASTAAAAMAERRNSPVPTNSSPNGSRRGSADATASTGTREGLVAAAAARRASISAGTSISTSATNGPDAKDHALFTSSSNASTSSGGRRTSVSSSQPSHTTPTVGHAREIGVHLPFHGSNSLIKQYTLQNAESGLAADYVKKRNVVRVRVEGEQFLLQTESAKDVVDWIEAFQAATNVSLDLDQRPMPKIITLPRRRRRRRPGEPTPPSQQTGVPDTEDTPEGNARAVAEAERAAAAARDRNIDDMERMLAEDQAA
ncbi:hypothetical protein QFC19_005468 [Naganishia cerealis]|uniref:Uncharacterized protein n=1 Tax=Naganishia cerealis TaxID=610337 RepID=A0ACC2VNM4_9TREE|nr:hypothetical protein QFC19_005468 [Naganishia cerealis]